MMNDRQQNPQPLTKLDLAVRFTVVASVSLFGIALTLDADEVQKPVAKDLPVIAPRQVDTKPTRNPMIFDNSVFERLSRKPTKTTPKTVTQELPVAKTPAPRIAAKKAPLKQIPLKMTLVEKTPPTKTTVKPKAAPESFWQLDEELLEQSTTPKHPLATRTPKDQPQSELANKSELWKRVPVSQNPTKKTRKAVVGNDQKSVAVKSPKPPRKRSSAFKLSLDKLPAQLVSIPKKSPQRTKPTPARKVASTKKRNATPIRQRLANLYSKVAPQKPTKVTTKKSAPAVKPAKHIEKPATNSVKTAAAKKPTTRSTARPLWDLNRRNNVTPTKRNKVPALPPAPVSVAKSQPPVSKSPIPQPPTAPKPSESQLARKSKPTVQQPVAKKESTRKTTPRLLKFGSVVGKLFPGKKAQPEQKTKTSVATKEPRAKAPSTPIPPKKKQATKSLPLPPVGTLAAKPKQKKPTITKTKTDRLPLDETVAEQKTTKPTRSFSLDELQKPAKVERVAVSEDPVFDLQVIDDFDFQFLPPLVAERKQEPPAPAGGAEEEPETLGYNGFKPIGEVTVDINVVKGEDPPDLAAPEFEDAEPIVLNTEWVDQTLTAPLLPFYHQPLYFEDPNPERCGKTWGCLQPAASAGLFYLTIPALPYLIGAYSPHEEMESLGDCAEGCRYKCHETYLPRFSLKGIALQGAATTGLIFLIP